ncbi:MAG: OmpA family protein [Myxococcales bacterium]|nr:OmpA family protein [Myxococcales bacterium]
MRRISLSLSLAALTLLGGAPAAFAQQSVTLDGPAAQPTKKEAPDGTVRFQTGSSLITPESAAALDRIAEFILGQAAGDILVVGHTDRKGSEQANLRLSQSRAKKVKTELSKRGVPAWRIKVMGVGYGEPLSREETKAADDLNRRVEVWVGTKEAIAWISYIYRQVQAQKPAADWEGAELQMPLRRLFRVRTLERSAGEVSFGEGRTLFLGPSALVVIYGKDERKDPKPRAVADITVEQGSILASLGQAPVLADTKDARFRMKADWIRVDANEAKQQSTVSVYKGETTVNAENKTVKVEEGYGTRVKRGQAPEAPTPLPPAPQWDGSGTILAQEGRGVNLSWRPAIAHEGAMIELSGPDDPNLKRPRDTRFVEGRSAALDDVPAGVYWVRVSSVDERDIVGHPGVARRLVILPQPQAAEGQLTWSEDRWLLAKPGKVRLPQASGVKTTWLDEAGRPLPDVIEVGPGVRRLETRLTDDAGRELGAGVVLVEVRPMTMRLIEVESSKPMGDHDEVTFVVEARDAKGQPTDKLHLVAGEPDPRLLETTADPTWMMPLSSDRSGEGAVSSIGEGRYRLTRVLPKSQGSSARYVLVYDADRDIGQHILLPVTGPLTPSPLPTGEERLRLVHGLHLAVTGGVERARSAWHPGARAEIGWTIVAQDRLRLTLGVEAGYTKATVPAGKVDLFPVLARVTVGFLVGPVRPYVGFAGGVRVVSAKRDDGGTPDLETPKAAVEAIMGIGGYYRGFELFIEGRYGPTRVGTTEDLGTVGEPGLYGGLRYYFEQG